MATQRDRPYLQFNFLVDLGGGGDPASADGGFEECSGISSEITVVEYRTGNEKELNPRKLTGLTKVHDVTLRRGVIGTTTLWDWFKQVRDGDQAALRTVTIFLQDEHRKTVLAWKLLRARPVRWTVDPLSARRSDTAVEELVVAYERLEVG